MLDDVPENADYFDEIYLTFAELFSEFNRYGRLEDAPETIGKVCSFTTDEAAKNELLSALDALHSGTIQGRTRCLTAKWEAEGTWQDWHPVPLFTGRRDCISCAEFAYTRSKRHSGGYSNSL